MSTAATTTSPLVIEATDILYSARRRLLSAPVEFEAVTRRLEERKIHVELTDAAKEQLVREGYDPAYGARPLKRAIQRFVLDPLALRVLDGQFREGDTVVVDGGPGGLKFEKKTQEAVKA